MPRIRLDAEVRKTQLIEAAYEIARKHGIKAVTRAAVARQCKVSDGLINRYCDSRDGMRQIVLELAVEKKDAKTLAAASEYYELPTMPRNLAAEVKRLAS